MEKYNNTAYVDTVFFNIEQIAKYIQEDYLKRYNSEVTHDEFRALDIINYNADICQRDLAKLILRDCVRTGRILESLEKKGFIERFNDTKGSRLVKKMKLTPAGKKFYNDMLIKVNKGTEEFFKIFDDRQFNELNGSLKLLLENLKKTIEVSV